MSKLPHKMIFIALLAYSANVVAPLASFADDPATAPAQHKIVLPK